MPLHPALVHVPLGLAFVLGPVLAVLAWLARRESAPRALWWLGAVLAAVLAGGALAASSAGEGEALLLRDRVPHAAIDAHRDAAGALTWTAVLTAVLALVAGVAAKPRVRGALQLAAALLAFALVPLAIRAGQAGGDLVWKHGAPHARAAASP